MNKNASLLYVNTKQLLLSTLILKDDKAFKTQTSENYRNASLTTYAEALLKLHKI
jgi:hypothetical protein